MSVTATATEVFLSRAIPNLDASEPSFTSNPNPVHQQRHQFLMYNQYLTLLNRKGEYYDCSTSISS
jgi:hypothetical protein